MGGSFASIVWICDGEVSVRSRRSASMKSVARRAGRVGRREVERVEVVVGRLDLAAVDDLVAEPEEGVLDLAADLGGRVEVVRAAARRREA